MKSKLEVYALSVCFSAVICLVISLGVAGYSLFEIILPTVTIDSYSYNKHQTNEDFWDSIKALCGDDTEEQKQCPKPTEEVITKQRLKEFAAKINSEQRDGVQTLIKCFMFVLASGVALIIHWKIFQKSQENS
jgi:hypothetical protein